MKITNMLNRFIKWILFVTAAYCLPASALTTTTTLPIGANVINICDTLTATNLSFGNYNPTSSTPTTGTNSISMRCSINDAYTISLDSGQTSGASISQRMMTNGIQTLNYNLYTSSSHSSIWGDGITGGSTVAGSGTGALQTYTVYGLIPNNQVIAQGVFSDTITVSVNY
jgi:spore coat protein U-like protein